MSFILIAAVIYVASHSQINHVPIAYYSTDPILLLIGLPFTSCKDVFNGQNIPNRFLGLYIVRKKNEIASPLRTLFRNLFILLGPIELILALNSRGVELAIFWQAQKSFPQRAILKKLITVSSKYF